MNIYRQTRQCSETSLSDKIRETFYEREIHSSLIRHRSNPLITSKFKVSGNRWHREGENRLKH